ncbi:hypothetical protein PSTG_08767 [Puccinia striiformis f. sp. tritici PST-78]|uniref:Uncharacterized protein n=1 Tax=Puccinia striiformis f. sp. tritici PST-78 TaxID=1165861 RepID=A0A0L0VGI3_9BASI|nr:hypothetical protein PSTG_08767 [Puccinia striiformis f. sp. tritici PST-78]
MALTKLCHGPHQAQGDYQDQRLLAKDAGAITGLDVLHIINKPTTASIAYSFGMASDQKEKKKQAILISDLGGCTFDIERHQHRIQKQLQHQPQPNK